MVHDEGPLIIVGHGRSGTTLMQAILATHPDVAMFRRDPAWWAIFYRHPDYADLAHNPATRQKLADHLFQTPHIQNLQQPLDKTAVINNLQQMSNVSFGDVVRVIMEEYACTFGPPRWGYKSPGDEQFVDLIHQSVPNARFLHMIRDPRDTLASSRKAGLKHLSNSVRAFRRWSRSVRYAERNSKAYPDAYLTIKYEELVEEPEATVKRICDFFMLSYTDHLLTAEGQEFWRWRGTNSSFEKQAKRPIDASNVGRYKEALSSFDLLVCELMLGKWLNKYQYDLHSPTVGLISRFKAVSFITFHSVIWNTWESLRPIVARLGLRDLRKTVGVKLSN